MNEPVRKDALVVGGGISGLSLAGALRDAGQKPLVVERARGVGGRCATRRVEGRPVDHGVPFLHGRHPEFLAALDAVAGATPIQGWPATRIGGGMPCQPEAFEGSDRLVAFREGLTQFPKHLARGLDVRLGAEVTFLRMVEEQPLLEASVKGADPIQSGVVALTMPSPHAERLLGPLCESSPALAATSPLRRQIRMLPCLAVIAVYDGAVQKPDWDAFYPLESTMVHAVLHDSAKRGTAGPLTLVVQGRPRFSREYLEAPVKEWAGELLWEAGEFMGAWAERPVHRQEHTWHYARVEPMTELAAPLVIRLENGATLAFCGDGYDSNMGLEGAFLSGRSLAERLEADGVLTAGILRKETT